MKLIFENWRKFLLTEITLSQVVDRMENSKVLAKFIKSRIWDPETKTLSLAEPEIQRIADRLATRLRRTIPNDLEEKQRALSLQWLLSRGLRDKMIADALWLTTGGYDPNAPPPGLEAELAAGQGYSMGMRFLEEIRSDLEYFFQWQDFMEEKDIFSIQNFDQLQAAVAAARPLVKKHQEGKKYLDVAEGTEVFRDDNKWKIYAIHNKGAACEYGKGTKWCTAAPGLKWFEHYYKEDDPLFYFEYNVSGVPDITPWGENIQKYQFHYGTEQYMDEADIPVPDDKAEELTRLLIDAGVPEKYSNVFTRYDKMRAEGSKDPKELEALMEKNWRRIVPNSYGRIARYNNAFTTVLAIINNPYFPTRSAITLMEAASQLPAWRESGAGEVLFKAVFSRAFDPEGKLHSWAEPRNKTTDGWLDLDEKTQIFLASIDNKFDPYFNVRISLARHSKNPEVLATLVKLSAPPSVIYDEDGLNNSLRRRGVGSIRLALLSNPFRPQEAILEAATKFYRTPARRLLHHAPPSMYPFLKTQLSQNSELRAILAWVLVDLENWRRNEPLLRDLIPYMLRIAKTAETTPEEEPQQDDEAPS